MSDVRMECAEKSATKEIINSCERTGSEMK